MEPIVVGPDPDQSDARAVGSRDRHTRVSTRRTLGAVGLVAVALVVSLLIGAWFLRDSQGGRWPEAGLFQIVSELGGDTACALVLCGLMLWVAAAAVHAHHPHAARLTALSARWCHWLATGGVAVWLVDAASSDPSGWTWVRTTGALLMVVVLARGVLALVTAARRAPVGRPLGWAVGVCTGLSLVVLVPYSLVCLYVLVLTAALAA